VDFSRFSGCSCFDFAERFGFFFSIETTSGVIGIGVSSLISLVRSAVL
jgi:hypothetical protein